MRKTLLFDLDGTLLMAIRAFGFDKPHHRVRDYLPKVKSK